MYLHTGPYWAEPAGKKHEPRIVDHMYFFTPIPMVVNATLLPLSANMSGIDSLNKGLGVKWAACVLKFDRILT